MLMECILLICLESDHFQVLDIFLSDCVTEFVKKMYKEEEECFHQLCSQQMASIMVEVTLEDCRNIVKNVIRQER
jgi:uncharacterized protein YbcI